MDQEEAVYVTMHVFAKKQPHELRTNHLRTQVDTAITALMRPIQGGEELAKRLSLPTNVPLKWDVHVVSVADVVSGDHPILQAGQIESRKESIPMMISVSQVPKVLEELRSQVLEEVINIIFKESQFAESSKDLARALGYASDEAAKFHIHLPHEVRLHGPERLAVSDGGYEIPVWVEGGWSKGCSSWPW